MKLVMHDNVSVELEEYLLTQDGITKADVNFDGYYVKLDIEYNEKVTPIIIMKYIDLFCENSYSCLFEFDKESKGKFKVLNYTVKNMCCEYCYMGFVMDLFENNKIKSVKSNFDFNKPAFNIEFLIEYNENYSEQELIKYIKEKYN